MKYTDEQRIAKIKEYTDKLLEYVKKAEITRETISDDETIQWTFYRTLELNWKGANRIIKLIAG